MQLNINDRLLPESLDDLEFNLPESQLVFGQQISTTVGPNGDFPRGRPALSYIRNRMCELGNCRVLGKVGNEEFRDCAIKRYFSGD